jgi:hypothetical protein
MLLCIVLVCINRWFPGLTRSGFRYLCFCASIVQEVMIDLFSLVSSISRVIAWFVKHTKIDSFTHPMKKPVSVLYRCSLKGNFKGIHGAVLDVPWRVYEDIAWIGKILPKLRSKTQCLFSCVPVFLTESNALKYTFVRDLNEIYMDAIQPCNAGSYVWRDLRNSPMLLKKFSTFVKRNPLISVWMDHWNCALLTSSRDSNSRGITLLWNYFVWFLSL